MPVATMLAIAASFWGSHGYTATQPVVWDWGITTYDYREFGTQGYATFGNFHISMSRYWWDHTSNQDRCVVVIHEYGHAAFSFKHKPNTIMSAYDDETRPVPGVCKRSQVRWRAAIARTAS